MKSRSGDVPATLPFRHPVQVDHCTSLGPSSERSHLNSLGRTAGVDRRKKKNLKVAHAVENPINPSDHLSDWHFLSEAQQSCVSIPSLLRQVVCPIIAFVSPCRKLLVGRGTVLCFHNTYVADRAEFGLIEDYRRLSLDLHLYIYSRISLCTRLF